MFSLVFLLALSIAHSSATFTRENAWTCIMNVIDTDHDKAVTIAEMNSAKDTYMYWYEKVVGYLPFIPTMESVMHDCDANNDGKIDAADYEAKKKYCVPYNDPKTNWKTKSDALVYVKKFCDRAAGVLNKSVY